MKKSLNLFQLGDFKLHSGKKSQWKIDCDALTEKDYETLAWIVGEEWKMMFRIVYGIPTGGLKFVKALDLYKKEDSNVVLIVDDVLTTGRSMEEKKTEIELFYQHNENITTIVGVVIFARGKCPKWVRPIFQMNNRTNIKNENK